MRPGFRMPRGSNALRSRAATAATAGGCGWNTARRRARRGGRFEQRRMAVGERAAHARRVDGRVRREDQPAAPVEQIALRLEPLEHARRVGRRHRDPPHDGRSRRARAPLASACQHSRDASPSSTVCRRAAQLVAERARARFDRRRETLRAAATLPRSGSTPAADTSCGERSAALEQREALADGAGRDARACGRAPAPAPREW